VKTTKKIAAFETKFKVEGSGEFPVDMLRYDTCFPLTENDAHVIALQRGTRQVTLVRRSLVPTEPTAGRWQSFGWRIIEVLPVQL
jgi:hypothetical protein